MGALATTRLSSKGQIVIPDDIRKNLRLHSGDQFVVVGSQDVIILKLIAEPPLEDFASLIKTARAQAAKAKLTKAGLQKTIIAARKRR